MLHGGLTVTSPISDVAGSTVESVKTDAQALGLKWGLVPATIISADDDNIKGQMDGDESATVTLLSLIGYVSPGTRVMTMTVPPSGTYIIAAIGYENDSAWTDYAMVTTSSGTPPSVGSGSQGMRWVKIAHKTILLEGFVLFGCRGEPKPSPPKTQPATARTAERRFPDP